MRKNFVWQNKEKRLTLSSPDVRVGRAGINRLRVRKVETPDD